MRERCVVLLLVAALSVTVLQPGMLLGIADAEQAGAIIITADSMTVDPAAPVDGSATIISVMLSNVDSYTAANKIHEEFASVVAGSSASVSTSHTFVDSHLASTPGERLIIAYWQNGGEENWSNRTVLVTSLPNLIISSLVIEPAGELLAAQAFNVSVQISNVGGADAAVTHLSLVIGEFAVELASPAVPAGAARWVNTSLNAPVESGTLMVTVNSNPNDAVPETSLADNIDTTVIAVVTPPNYYHDGTVSIVETIGALAGPWTVSGQVRRMGGEGASSITLSIQRAGGIAVRNLQLDFTTEDPLAEWSTEIATQNLGSSEPGTISLEIIIDPSQEVLQSTRFDDTAATSLTIHPVPNVVVSALASASPSEVRPGEPVTFTVSVQNVGSIAVSGTLQATFPCGAISQTSHLIPAPSGVEPGSITVTYDVTACTNTDGNLQFNATWTADAASHDSSTADNTATGFVGLLTTLRLRFLSDESWAPELPIIVGGNYRYSISVVSDEGAGNETFRCVDLISGVELNRQTLEFSATGATVEVNCQYEATRAGELQLAVIPSGPTVPTRSTVWSVVLDQNRVADTPVGQDRGIAIMFTSGILLIGVLVVAVILTRRTVGDADRETFEACPACGGEIEGDEEICPFCDFELVGGYGRFHDCAECDASIPSSMDHCSYCGAAQNLADFYEQRERREIVVEEVEEVQDDPDEYVSGTLDYDKRVSEFGLSEDALESDWDERLGEAESELDEIAAREADRAAEDDEEDVGERVSTTQLKQRVLEDESIGIDDFLAEKAVRRSLKDEDVKLSASDADIRADIFEVTGEDGVLPGQQVVAEEIIDHSIGGDVLPAGIESDFTSLDEDARHTEGLAEAVEAVERAGQPDITDQSSEQPVEPKKRRSIRRRKNGAGGAEVNDDGPAGGAEEPASSGDAPNDATVDSTASGDGDAAGDPPADAIDGDDPDSASTDA